MSSHNTLDEVMTQVEQSSFDPLPSSRRARSHRKKGKRSKKSSKKTEGSPTPGPSPSDHLQAPLLSTSPQLQGSGRAALGLSTILRREVEGLESLVNRDALTASTLVRVSQHVANLTELKKDLNQLITRYTDDPEKLDRFMRLDSLLDAALKKFQDVDFEWSPDASARSAALTASTHMVVASVPEEEEGQGPYPACSSSTMHGVASSSSRPDLVSVSDSEDGETTDDSAEVLDTLECCICWEDVDWEDTRALSPCNHRVCVTCLRNHATAMITEADIYGLTCPYSGCDTQLKVEQLQSILSTQLFDKLLRFSFIAAVKADELGKFCPHLECEWAGFVDKSQMISANKVQCPDCKNYFCYHCDKTFAGHDDRTCEEAAKWLEERGHRDDVLDAQFKIWMLESGGTTNSRLCPSCKIPIQKDGGCNHMSCRKCHHEWCWICGGDYDNGSHYQWSNWSEGCLQFGEPPDWFERKQQAQDEALKLRATLASKGVNVDGGTRRSTKKKRLFCTHQ